MLTAALAALRDRGAGVAWLEVIDQNQGALRLYEKLGFEVVRDLVVWSLPPRDANGSAARTIEASSAHAWIGAHRKDREPWQRADESVAAVVARGARLRGLAVERDGEIAAAAIVRDGDRVEALQVVAPDERAAIDLLLAAAGPGRELRLRNVPDDDPASLALDRLGARRIPTQHEMRVTL